MRALYVTLSIVVLDQLTKLLVKGFTLPFFDFYHAGMQLGQSIPVIGDFLRITFIENPGMAFGFEVSSRIWLVALTFIAALAICYYLYTIRNEKLFVRLPFAMILGGAIGNLIDRVFYGVIFGEAPLFYGKVVDFIDMDFFNINILGYHVSRFAVYNIADSSVTIGIILMLIFHRKIVKEENVQLATNTSGSSSDTSFSPGTTIQPNIDSEDSHRNQL